jgi:hypothetical protein
MSIYSAAYVGELNKPVTNQVAVTAIAQQLPDMPCKLLFIKNDDTSTVPVYIGAANVTTLNGFKLTAGEGIAFTCVNANVFYCVATGPGATIDLISMS